MKRRSRSYPDNKDIFARKAAGRIERASISFSEKLRILDEMKSRLEPMIRAKEYLRQRGTPND